MSSVKNNFLYFLGATLILSGCVSAGKYRRLETESNSLRDSLSRAQQKLTAYEADIAALNKAHEDMKAQQEAELAQTKSTYENLVGEMKQEIQDGQVKITQIQGKLTVNVAEKIFFNSGQANLKQKGREVLGRVGTILKNVKDKQIRIEGHTDSVPIGGDLKKIFPTNWELSTARATNVARFLQEKVGIDPALLSAIGYGPYRPIASNDTEEGLLQNRRIEIVLLDKEVGQAAPLPANTTNQSPAPPEPAQSPAPQ
ncbi:MAG: OmpA family protein [Elusimicrobia bacterium]|nr:OmpA family protein [Elusimicrobiota bacterium]